MAAAVAVLQATTKAFRPRFISFAATFMVSARISSLERGVAKIQKSLPGHHIVQLTQDVDSSHTGVKYADIIFLCIHGFTAFTFLLVHQIALVIKGVSHAVNDLGAAGVILAVIPAITPALIVCHPAIRGHAAFLILRL